MSPHPPSPEPPAHEACSNHPDRSARFRCDGCEALLCGECIQEGHRLLFCTVCGERALPLDTDEPADTRKRQETVKLARAASYTYREALGYPFRGTGAYAFWIYVGLQGLALAVHALPLVGGLLVLAVLIFLLLVGLLLPGFLFAITRTTAAGENELPDWPAFDVFRLLKQVFVFVWVGAVSLIPMAAMLRGFRCEAMDVVAGRADAVGCSMALVSGYFLGVCVWLPAFGSVAIFGSFWLLFRFDLHFKAARADYGEFFTAVGLTAGLLALSGVAPFVLSRLPLPDLIVNLTINALLIYSAFVGAHLAGVYFRRHSAAAQEIYGDV